MQGKEPVQRTIAGRRSIGAIAALLAVLGAVAILPVASAAGRRAQVVIHPGEGLRTVHPGLFGVNHRYPYDGFGMWDSATDSAYPRFEHRFNAAGFTAMRFPGGSVANTYHWERAIGPPSQRGLNIHGHTGEPLTNGFGPDEFGSFASTEGIQAMMMANFATGTAQEAADWVEYMNAPVGTNPNGGTAWASVRAANGHPAPYHVQNWEIGNELYQPGQTYWMGAGSMAKRTKKYIFGGSTSFKDQRVGTPDDHEPSAAVSDGSSNQSFQVWYPPVRPDKPFHITVDDKRWKRVQSLSSAPAGEKVYELDAATGTVAFGDGVHGAIPPEGSVVRASYKSGPHDGFVDYYSAMKAADPTIQVGSCFWNGHFLSMMGTKHPYDFVVRHIYSHLPPRGHHGVKQFHDGIMSVAGKRANEVIPLRHAINHHAGPRGKSIGIVVSEYGMSFGHRKGPTRNYLGSMDQAIYTGIELQRWMQLGIPLAGKQALMYFRRRNAPHGATSLGPPEQALIGPKPRYIMTATSRAFRLLTPNAGNELVRSGIRANPSRHIYNGRNMKMLSAVTTRTTSGELYVTIVNKARTWHVPTTVKVLGKPITSAVVKELVGPSYLSYNSYHHPSRVSIRTHKQWVNSRAMTIRIPAHSVVTLRLRR